MEGMAMHHYQVTYGYFLEHSQGSISYLLV